MQRGLDVDKCPCLFICTLHTKLKTGKCYSLVMGVWERKVCFHSWEILCPPTHLFWKSGVVNMLCLSGNAFLGRARPFGHVGVIVVVVIVIIADTPPPRGPSPEGGGRSRPGERAWLRDGEALGLYADEAYLLQWWQPAYWTRVVADVQIQIFFPPICRLAWVSMRLERQKIQRRLLWVVIFEWLCLQSFVGAKNVFISLLQSTSSTCEMNHQRLLVLCNVSVIRSLVHGMSFPKSLFCKWNFLSNMVSCWVYLRFFLFARRTLDC